MFTSSDLALNYTDSAPLSPLDLLIERECVWDRKAVPQGDSLYSSGEQVALNYTDSVPS